MQRLMQGFHQDPLGDWVAELDCGHTQHLRHQPPLQLCPWVLVPEERAQRVGQQLECPLCERRVLPTGFVPFRRTAPVKTGGIPDALLRQHSTKAAVWGLLHVSEGALELIELLGGGEQRQLVSAGEHAVIRPGVEHRVAPVGEVEFSVEFWRAPDSTEPAG